MLLVRDPKDQRQVTQVVNETARQLNNTGKVTLTASTTTTLVDPRITALSKIIPISKDAGSAAAQVYVNEPTEGQVLLGHLAGGAGRVIDYVIIGVR